MINIMWLFPGTLVPKLLVAISILFTMMTGGSTRNTRSGSITESNMDELRQFIRDYFKNEFLDEIKAVVRQQTEASIKDLVTDPMARLEQQLAQMNDLVTKVSAMETAMQFTSKRMDDLEKVSLPALASHVEQVASALALQTLDIDVHRRKLSLTVQGLKGDADEDDADTRRVSGWRVSTWTSRMQQRRISPHATDCRARRTLGWSYTSATLASATSGCWEPESLNISKTISVYVPIFPLSSDRWKPNCYRKENLSPRKEK